MRGKRQVQRKPVGLEFVRKADGRLKPAGEGREIGDVWAEIDRVKLREAIARDQRKRAKSVRLKRLFNREKPQDTKATGSSSDTKTVEIKINFPEMGRYLKVGVIWLGKKLSSLPLSRKQWWLVFGGIILLVSFIASFSLYGNNSPATENREDKQSGGTSADPGPKEPEYATLLPKGKNIDDLGGWGRVSPPGKEPVFAFRDNIDNVAISVSQQPLPESFKKNTTTAIAQLAESYAANEKIKAGSTDAYVGTSKDGPQSVILTKNELLILIKSAAKIELKSWESYLATLQ